MSQGLHLGRFASKSIFSNNIIAFVSDGSKDFTVDGQSPYLTSAQRQWLQRQIGCQWTHMVPIQQVHQSAILVVDDDFVCTVDSQKTYVQADGIISNQAAFALLIRIADCLPVFIYDPVQQCLGLIHAGWRGTRDAIVGKAVERMQTSWGCRPRDLIVAFGPSIQSCCYAVSSSFEQDFLNAISRRGNQCYLDLPQVNQQQLIAAGVLAEHIHGSDYCTCCQPQFSSYRREGSKARRMIALMMRVNS